MIIEDTEILNKYASKGYERVASHYDWDVVTTQYLTAYDDVLDNMSGESSSSHY
jgi:glycosyltransferase involved in cell wall biosynthesis